METLEKIQTRHKAILTALNQVESILQPIHTGTGKYDNIIITPFNLERLAKHSDLLSSEFCGVKVIKEQKEKRFAANYPVHYEDIYKVNIESENLGYTFVPELICEAKKRIEKSFKAVESFNKKQPARTEESAEMSIKTGKVLKTDSIKLPKDTKKVYICTQSEGNKPVQHHEKNQVNEINDELKTVNFQIEGKYIDQIKAGNKTEDYRSISPVNAKKLCDHINKSDLQPGEQYVTHNKEIWRLKKDLTHVRFFNGYHSDRKELLCELKSLELNKFIKVIPEGMKPGTICFTLILGQIVVSKNFPS